MKTLYRLSLLLLLTSLAVAALPARASSTQHSEHFVRPAELEPDIAFWRRIYTEVTTEGGVLHDPEELGVVYEVLKFPSDIAPKSRTKRIDDSKKKYSRILDRLAAG